MVDGALIQVDEEGNEILKTPMKEKKTERTCSVAERKMWDDLSTSVFSVFETVLDSDSVTKDFKDKDGGLEVLTSTLNHLNHALQDKSSISWWTHLIQVRKLLKLITKTHETCIVPSLQSKTLSRNSKLNIAKRYKRLCEAEKCVIKVLCSVNRLSCEKEENTNNMNAVRHVLYDRWTALLGSNSRVIFISSLAENMTKSYGKVSMRNRLKLFESVIGGVSDLLERLIAMSSSSSKTSKSSSNTTALPGVVKRSDSIAERIDIVQKCLLELIKITCDSLNEASALKHRTNDLPTLFYVLVRVSSEGCVVPTGIFGEEDDVLKTLLTSRVRTQRGVELRKSVLEIVSLAAVSVFGKNKGEKILSRILNLNSKNQHVSGEDYSIEDLFKMADASKKNSKNEKMKPSELKMIRSLLMSKCRSILSHFVERGSTERVCDVLTGLLELDSGTTDELNWIVAGEMTPPKRLLDYGSEKNISSKRKIHLLYLMPLLVKCVATDLKKERLLAQACLEAALLEIGYRRVGGSSEL